MRSRFSYRNSFAAACWLAATAWLAAPSGQAGTHSWTGQFSQNFQGANNWSPTGVPVDGDLALISTQSANVFLSAATRVDQMSMSNGSLLRTNAQTLKIDESLLLTRNTGEEVILTLSSGASGIDLDATSTTINLGAAIVMEPNSQWRVVESAIINPGSSVSGSGLIEITGVLATGFKNNGTLTAQGLTLRKTAHAGSTFDLDGTSESGVVNVTGSLDLQTNLSDAFDGRWDQQLASFAEVVDFTLGPDGEMNLFGGSGPAGASLSGRNLVFLGLLDARVANGASAGLAQVEGDSITFGDGAQVNRRVNGELVTQGPAFFGDVTMFGDGTFQHFGELTVTGDALITDGFFVLGNSTPQAFTINPGASLVVERIHPTLANVVVGDQGLIDVRMDWLLGGSLQMGGPQATIRTSSRLFLESSNGGAVPSALTGSGRFEAEVQLDWMHVQPGIGDTPGSFYFEQLTMLSTNITELDISASRTESLSVGGAAIVNGLLTLRLIDGFSPSPGSVFPLIAAGSLSGQFHGSPIHPFGSGPGEFLFLSYDADSLVAYAPLAGDANLDGQVSGADYTNWADHFGQSGDWQDGDFNGDGLVSGADYTVWADAFGQGVSLQPGVAVPEPATAALSVPLLAAALAYALRRRSGLGRVG